MRFFSRQASAGRPWRTSAKALAALALAAASLTAAPAISAAATAPAPPAGLTFGPHAGGAPAILRHSEHVTTKLSYGVESDNWAGYASATSGVKYTEVSSTWVEPSANCAVSGNSMASFWTGFDGYASASVEQTGSLVYCYSGTAYQYVWYEFYPASPVYYNVPIYAGDVLTATVTSTSTGVFNLILTDSTRGWSENTTATNASLARSSAEIIAEAPSSGSGIYPLADFGTITFTNSTVNNAALTSSSPINIEMVGASDVKAVTGAISGTGTFTVTWEHAT
jgi:Peptidase A4 family